MTFCFVHEGPLEKSIAGECAQRNIVAYDYAEFSRFIDGLDAQLGAIVRVLEQTEDSPNANGDRLGDLLRKLADSEGPERHLAPAPNPSRDRVVEEIVEAVRQDPRQAIDFVRRLLS